MKPCIDGQCGRRYSSFMLQLMIMSLRERGDAADAAPDTDAGAEAGADADQDDADECDEGDDETILMMQPKSTGGD